MAGKDGKPASTKKKDRPSAADGDGAPSPGGTTRRKPEPPPKEIGGRGGPDPTRYGDWEIGGRCIDF